MRQSLSKSRQPQPGDTIDSLLVRLLCGYIRKKGRTPEAVFGAPLDENADVRLSRWHELLDIAATRLDDPAIGLSIAQHASWRDFGLVGYLGQSCATLGEALQRSTQYSQLIAQRNKTSFALENGLVVLSWTPERSRTQQLVDGLGIGMIVAMLRELIGDIFKPERVDFISPAPADAEVYRRYFGCPVHFDQACSRLCFSMQYLETPLPSPEPGLVALLDEQAHAKLHEIPVAAGDMSRLHDQLVQLISEGKTRLRDLAEMNFMSVRALQRFLNQQGSSFQQLLDQTRLGLAKEYLADTRLDLSAVANLVGYSEQSSFTRAFQQWTNFTPGQWRNDHALSVGSGLAFCPP